jgi:G3E family GTPase
MIPICLVTGFLGAGKTSLLKNMARRHKNRRLVYLVNEFSPNDIDGALVSGESDSVVSIPGGSIFCKCLVTEFIGTLKSLPERFPDVEGVIIEASGMANPKVIQTMLDETGMSKIYELARIVSVIDPNSFLKLRCTLPNIVAQVEAADMILMNKVDCSSHELCEETRAAVREVNAGVEIADCQYADHDFKLFPGREGRELEGEYAECKDPNYATETLAVSVDDMAELERLIKGWGMVYRAKGSVSIGGVRKGIEYSASGLVMAPELDCAEGLVVIRKGEQGGAG